jgi:hypothetical protein
MKQQQIFSKLYMHLNFPVLPWLIFTVVSIFFTGSRASAQYTDWKHSGSIYILTTPEGANLPASALVKNFPLLIRLNGDNFSFSEADVKGNDLRFSANGEPLSYEIEDWDTKAETATIWIKIPIIRGNDRQQIKIHWGNPGSKSDSDGTAVFNASNGYIGVWHLGNNVQDAAENLNTEDKGTTKAEGVIGKARHFPGNMGLFCGDDIQILPSGGSAHTTQVWFRSGSSNGRIIGWGNEKRQGKVTMMYQSPPGVRMDCYFSTGDARAKIPASAEGWINAINTYENGQSIIYINGEKQGVGNPETYPLDIMKPSGMWIGGWNNNYDYCGKIDEVRISGVARSADWVRLEYENQKPLQTLVGPVVQSGNEFSLSESNITMNENGSVNITARAGGAQNVYWSVVKEDEEFVIASNRFKISFNAGRISGDQKFRIRFDAVFSNGVRSIEIPVTVEEKLPEPEFTIKAPKHWDGRETIEVQPEIKNIKAMDNAGVGVLNYSWEISGLAATKHEEPGKLILTRAQNSGKMTVKLSLSNGGDTIPAYTDIIVQEPETDLWIHRIPGENEMPVEGQFYARDKSGEGTLFCMGTLKKRAGKVFLRVFADDKKFAEEYSVPGRNDSYHFAVKLKPGLIKYRIEFGTGIGNNKVVLHQAGDIVCGDAYLIEGQSNALATDTREESPRVTNEWVRSYGHQSFFKEGQMENLWCKPVWKAQKEHLAELGWWGMELANRLVESQKIPIFILNGANGGTRIDQHQRNDKNPTDLNTIYGRMLWRIKEARLTHGIRGIIWHQGESDQGAAGPDGDFGWKSYQRYFVEMSAGWKKDFPNVSRYYAYQIWPNACSMGEGNGDMLREVQRTLPSLYSNMDIMSTLGIKPPGGCHFPLIGWSEFARLIQPLIERDFYGRKVTAPITPADLQQAYYTSAARDAVALEFDQPVIWKDSLVNEFRLDGTKGKVASGVVLGNVLTLRLKEPVKASMITYLDEIEWKMDELLFGKNGIAALTFCNVPIMDKKKTK